jgi:hypothetical protein
VLGRCGNVCCHLILLSLTGTAEGRMDRDSRSIYLVCWRGKPLILRRLRRLPEVDRHRRA